LRRIFGTPLTTSGKVFVEGNIREGLLVEIEIVRGDSVLLKSLEKTYQLKRRIPIRSILQLDTIKVRTLFPKIHNLFSIFIEEPRSPKGYIQKGKSQVVLEPSGISLLEDG